MSSGDGDGGGSGGGGRHHSKPHSTNRIHDNGSRVTYNNMPASTTSLNPGSRMQMAAVQSLHDFSAALPFPVTYSTSSPGLFLYSDDVFETLSRSPKDDPRPHHKPLIGGRASPSVTHIKKEADPYVHELRSPSSPDATTSRNDHERSDNVPSLMLVSVSAFAEDGSDATASDRTARRERLVGENGIRSMIGVNHHHQQLLRYPPSGGDALLSTSAVGYGDNEMLQEGGFHGLLSGGGNMSGTGGGGVAPPTFELFEGEGGQDTFSADGVGDELHLSPHSFNLNDGSNVSSTADVGTDGVVGVDEVIDSNKLSVPNTTAAKKPKSKSRPNKTSSPNRTGSQSCPVCNKIFSNSSALAKHKLTHSDERKYVCQMCTKAFKRQDHLNGHLLTHMNKKPYACKVEGCGKSYCDARSLRRHTENHHANTSAAAAAAVVAATKAKVNAIRVGNHAPLTGAGLLPFGGEEVKVEALNSYITSNRICYAPPPPQQQPPSLSTTSDTSNHTTITSNVLQSVLTSPPMNAFHRSPSPSASNLATAITTSSSSSSAASSAATQLQLLAFQQQQEPRSTTSVPGPGTSLLSWQLQQPRANSRLFYTNSVHGQQPPTQQSLSRTTREIVEDFISQPVSSAATTLTTSVLAQHLRMGVSPSSSHSGSLLQESLASRLSPQPHMSGGLQQEACNVLQMGTASMQQQQQPVILDHLREQWTHPQTLSFALTNGPVPVIAPVVKQVECSICQRKFKNTPALNGHMRLHGGYLKKDHNDITKRVEKKSDHGSHPSSNHPPLQTASMNIRALIEEKIIQRRIVNPPVTTSIPPTPLLSVVTPSGPEMRLDDCHSSPQPRSDEFMDFNPECKPNPLQVHYQHQQIHHQNMVPMHPSSSSAMMADDPNQYHHHHHQQQTDSLGPPSPPSPPIETVPESPYASDPMPMDTEDEAQSDMQRQIEIIKQGLMSNQHISEKFRRHSDSDHFLAPRLLLYDDGCFSAGALADFFQRRAVVGKRTQRTGSDPGEFVFGHMSDGLLPDDVVVAMDELRASESAAVGDLDDDVGLPSSDIMDFEVGANVDDENLASTLSLQTLDRSCETSLLATALTGGHAMSMDVVVMPSSQYSPTVGGESSAFAPYGDIQEQVSLSVSSTNKIKQEEDDDVFLSPSSIPTSPIRGKKKHRPEPLFIPPQVNTCGFQSRLRSPRLWDPVTGGKACSPPPYTPPPMLSPVRCGSGLFWHVRNNSGSMTPKSAPLTPGRQMSLASVCGFQTEVQPVLLEAEEEDICEAPETDILPHVNIGSQFQARLPICRPFDRKYDRRSADFIWDPCCVESISDKEVEMYLQFACCAAVPGGGRNKEYALHVLQMASGNIQEAMLKLMDPAPRLRKNHPLLKYPYAECDKWSTEEIEAYQQALMNFDKDFLNVSSEMKTKSMKECIQFYYLWKKMCPDDYKKLRITRRRRETEGLLYGLRSKEGGEDSDNTPKSDDAAASPGRHGDVGNERFVCDHPDCFASFVSRQALNGHIRIHGGNTTVRGVSNVNRSRSPGNEDAPVASKYSPANNLPPSNASTNFGEILEEFPCKICGKVFSKVKSRSAHMKSHRPIDPERCK